MTSASTWRASSTDGTHAVCGVTISCGSQHWGLYIPRESENHVNVGPVSVWDIKDPLRLKSISTSIEQSVQMSEK